MRIRSFSVLALGALPILMAGQQLHADDLKVANDSAPAVYEELLTKHATPSGVRYDAWHANTKDLESLAAVTEFYATTLPPQERNAALAWHLNAYNAAILQEILKKYPTKGPLDGETDFFDKARIVISGKKISLNHLEQKLIRPTFQEPRMHFALNCASESCPPLATKPFTAQTLDADLDRLTRAFINDNPQGVVVKNKRPQISKLFDWYAEDFGGKSNLIAYINRYRNSPIPDSPKVDFFDYSWKLNAVN